MAVRDYSELKDLLLLKNATNKKDDFLLTENEKVKRENLKN